MKTRWSLAVLTVANLVVLIGSLATMRPVAAQGVPAVLRGRALEIVDDQGRVRASLTVLPAGTSAKGDHYVILEAKGTSSSLKLRNEDGREQTVKP